MLETMTYVGIDVHARSVHAAAIDVGSGELRRARFGGGSDQVVEWLQTLPLPLKGCYEAGPTGYGLYRAAAAAGLELDVVAPSKTPRALEGDWSPTVGRLRCFRGIDTLTAFVLALEIGDFSRFPRPGKLTGWLGLVPSLEQSGESRRQGAITKTGSGYARRLLVEAA